MEHGAHPRRAQALRRVRALERRGGDRHAIEREDRRRGRRPVALGCGHSLKGVAVAALTLCLSALAHAADNPAEVFELPSVDVVGVTPLPGLGTALRDVPANVQRFGATDLSRQRPLTLTQFL